MTEEEIKEYLKRFDELELKLTDEDKDTYQWLLFGYNKCARLLNEKEQENKILKENAENNDKVVDKVNWENQLLKKENKQLKDNWNRLKEIVKSQSGFKKRADLKGGLWFEIDELLDKMQELEQGSDSNE